MERITGVEIDDFFQGSALNAVDAKGRLSVPAFVRAVVERRSDAPHGIDERVPLDSLKFGVRVLDRFLTAS